MRWYLNDVSLQAQFAEPTDFLVILQNLLALRAQFEPLRSTLYVTKTLSTRNVNNGLTLVQLLGKPEHRGLQAQVLRWLGRAGPFIEDDRSPEVDDYFEFKNHDVTNTGLGEASRRVKAGEQAATVSFSGGALDFAYAPLTIFHGIAEDRLGQYEIANLWSVEALRKIASKSVPPPANWRELIERARTHFPNLSLPDAIYLNTSLAREPFNSIICDRTLVLLGFLNQYMDARRPDGSETPEAQKIIKDYFSGDRAIFSGESQTNQRNFQLQLTFPDPDAPDRSLFAHWHGKISHRFFRLHFEWPVPINAQMLKVVYLGPKITKE
jgi:hypothetical protein